MNQSHIIFRAEGGNNDVNAFSDSDAHFPELSTVRRRFLGNLESDKFNSVQIAKQLFDFIILSIVLKPLQKLAVNQIAQ
jgi:hypothetical protein